MEYTVSLIPSALYVFNRLARYAFNRVNFLEKKNWKPAPLHLGSPCLLAETMPRKPTAEQLKKRAEKEAKRVQAVTLHKQGKKPAEIAKAVGLDRTTVYSIIKRWGNEGSLVCKGKQKPGRKPKVDERLFSPFPLYVCKPFQGAESHLCKAIEVPFPRSQKNCE